MTPFADDVADTSRPDEVPQLHHTRFALVLAAIAQLTQEERAALRLRLEFDQAPAGFDVEAAR